MEIELVKWDSEFFGFKTGRVQIQAGPDFDPVLFRKSATAQGYELVYVVKSESPLSAATIREGSMELMDIMLTMSLKLDKEKQQGQHFVLRNSLEESELLETYHIAEETARVSRFYMEPKTGPAKTKKMYRHWVDNALNQTYADGVLLEKEQGAVAGILLPKTHPSTGFGQISMVGVNPSFFARGVGTRLWQQTLGYYHSRPEITRMMTKLSLLNLPSLNWHLKCGFTRIEETVFVYHFRSNGAS